MAIDEDKILFQQIKAGNKPAFDTLFQKYYVRLCHFALSYLKSEELAEETVQDTFVKIWCQRNTMDISTSVVAYLFIAVKNQAFNELKKITTRKKYEIEYTEELSGNTDDKQPLDDQRVKQVIATAVKQLPEKCREIFQLCKNDGLSYEEIAEYLSVSKKTVENQMGIAFKKLREQLKPLLAQFYD